MEHALALVHPGEARPVCDAAVGVETPLEADGLEQHRERTGGVDRRGERTAAEHDRSPREQVVNGEGERDRALLEGAHRKHPLEKSPEERAPEQT